MNISSHYFAVDHACEMLETGLDPAGERISTDEATKYRATHLDAAKDATSQLDEALVQCKVFAEKSRISGLADEIGAWGADIAQSPFNRRSGDPQRNKSASQMRMDNQELIQRCRKEITGLELEIERISIKRKCVQQ